MIAWIKKIAWKKTFLVGFLYTIVATLIHQLEAIATLKYPPTPDYFGVWSKLVLTYVIGLSFAIIYYYLRDHLPQNPKARIFYFADLCVAFNFICFLLPSYLMFNLPLGLLSIWFIGIFFILTINSLLLVKLLK